MEKSHLSPATKHKKKPELNRTGNHQDPYAVSLLDPVPLVGAIAGRASHNRKRQKCGKHRAQFEKTGTQVEPDGSNHQECFLSV